MDITSWIQAIASMILVLVTWKYVGLTNRMLHAPHRAFLTPTEVHRSSTGRGWEVKVRNHGPGLALNIKLRKTVLTGLLWDQEPPHGSEWQEMDIVCADGPFELAPREEGIYHFKNPMHFGDPFFLRVTTTSGERLKSAWIKRGDRMEPVGFQEVAGFALKWAWRCLRTPYLKVLKWRRFRNVKRSERG